MGRVSAPGLEEVLYVVSSNIYLYDQLGKRFIYSCYLLFINNKFLDNYQATNQS